MGVLSANNRPVELASDSALGGAGLQGYIGSEVSGVTIRDIRDIYDNDSVMKITDVTF